MNRDYPPDWDERRRRVYRRDNYTCQDCGARGGRDGNTELHAHHVVPRSRGGGDHLDNLETLCLRCHNAAHNHDIRPNASSESQQTTAALEELSGVGVASVVTTVILVFVGAFTDTYRLVWVAAAVFVGAVLYESYLNELDEGQEPSDECNFTIGVGIIGTPILIYTAVSLLGWPTAAFIIGFLILYALYRI